MTERFSSSALGFVCIVGAGPGPLGLMTLRALDRLRRADVVVHDRLVSTKILDQIPPQAQRAYVGKALGDHAVPQEGIHALLVAHARPGQTRVFYMGVQRLAQIAERLFSHGLVPDTPAAIVRDGTRPTQTVIACSLRRLVEMAPAYGPQPGLLIIGETVRMSPYYHAD